MKLKITLTAFILGTVGFTSAQGTFIYDQQSTGITDGGFFLSATPFGQSFTPTLDSLGFVDLQLSSGVSTTIDVNIRSGSITGLLLGTSMPVTLQGSSSGVFDFLFSNPVTLTPGTQYFFEPVVVGPGDAQANTTSIQYPGGDLIANGAPVTAGDLWFREGVVTAVPEPASATLLVVAGVLFWKRRKL
jgi:hypothetical protein